MTLPEDAFDAVALDKNKDVLVLVANQECPECQDARLVVEQVASAFRDEDSVVVVHITGDEAASARAR